MKTQFDVITTNGTSSFDDINSTMVSGVGAQIDEAISSTNTLIMNIEKAKKHARENGKNALRDPEILKIIKHFDGHVGAMSERIKNFLMQNSDYASIYDYNEALDNINLSQLQIDENIISKISEFTNAISGLQLVIGRELPSISKHKDYLSTFSQKVGALKIMKVENSKKQNDQRKGKKKGIIREKWEGFKNSKFNIFKRKSKKQENEMERA